MLILFYHVTFQPRHRHNLCTMYLYGLRTGWDTSTQWLAAEPQQPIVGVFIVVVVVESLVLALVLAPLVPPSVPVVLFRHVVGRPVFAVVVVRVTTAVAFAAAVHQETVPRGLVIAERGARRLGGRRQTAGWPVNCRARDFVDSVGRRWRWLPTGRRRQTVLPLPVPLDEHRVLLDQKAHGRKLRRWRLRYVLLPVPDGDGAPVRHGRGRRRTGASTPSPALVRRHVRRHRRSCVAGRSRDRPRMSATAVRGVSASSSPSSRNSWSRHHYGWPGRSSGHRSDRRRRDSPPPAHMYKALSPLRRRRHRPPTTDRRAAAIATMTERDWASTRYRHLRLGR